MSLRNGHTLFRTVVIPANSIFHQDITGRFFFVKSATDKFKLTIDEGTEFELEAGDRLEMPLVDGKQSTFNKLSFRNPTSTQMTVTFHAGTIIVSTGTPYVYTRPAPTYIVPLAGTLIAYSTPTTFNIPNTNTRAGQTYPDSLAKVIISARVTSGTSVALDIFKTGDLTTSGGRIQTGLPWVLETSDALTIRGYGSSVSDGDVGYNISAFYNLNA